MDNPKVLLVNYFILYITLVNRTTSGKYLSAWKNIRGEIYGIEYLNNIRGLKVVGKRWQRTPNSGGTERVDAGETE